jgi:peptide deformylase
MSLSLPPALGPLAPEDHPVLHAPTAPVPEAAFDTPELHHLCDTMIATMRGAKGVGLAATQIGVPLRVAVLEDRYELSEESRRARDRRSFELIEIVNPTMRLVEGEMREFLEGCLSAPGKFGLVERALRVVVQGYDRLGRPLEFDATGWQARIFQHEVDHLDGRLCTSRMTGPRYLTLEEYMEYAPVPGPDLRRILGW